MFVYFWGHTHWYSGDPVECPWLNMGWPCAKWGPYPLYYLASSWEVLSLEQLGFSPALANTYLEGGGESWTGPLTPDWSLEGHWKGDLGCLRFGTGKCPLIILVCLGGLWNWWGEEWEEPGDHQAKSHQPSSLGCWCLTSDASVLCSMCHQPHFSCS